MATRVLDLPVLGLTLALAPAEHEDVANDRSTFWARTCVMRDGSLVHVTAHEHTMRRTLYIIQVVVLSRDGSIRSVREMGRVWPEAAVIKRARTLGMLHCIAALGGAL